MPRPYFYNNNFQAEILRVNQAGEFGAKRIYEGQLKAIKNSKTAEVIEDMLQQELKHLEYFNSKVANANIRPSLLLPLWDKIGFMAGYLSAILGDKYAMSLTQNIEEVIIAHYQQQIDYLKNFSDDQSIGLREKIEQFKNDEAEHIDIALDNDSGATKLKLVTQVIIKNLCKLAINLSKKI